MALIRNCLRWEPPKEFLPIEFCSNTSLHGLKYVGQEKRNILERIFWLIAFGIGIGVAIWMINGVWGKYKESPIITIFDDQESSVYQIPFPAITLCNINTVEKTKAEKIIKDAFEGKPSGTAKLSLLNHICTVSGASFSQRFGFTTNGTKLPEELVANLGDFDEDEQQITAEDFLQENAQTCENMIQLCLWQGKVENCSQLFHSVQTEFGKCCTFNSIPEALIHNYESDHAESHQLINEWARSKLNTDELWMARDEVESAFSSPTRKFPRRALKDGQSNGLSVLVNPGLKEYFCATMDSMGIKFSAHQVASKPDVLELGSILHPGSEILVEINPDILLADQTLRYFPTTTRNCYFSGEYQLKYFKEYTEARCVDECMANKTLLRCNCVPYYMPRDYDTDICGAKSFQCVTNDSSNWKGECEMCQPTCNSIDYHVEVHHNPLRADAEIWTNSVGARAKNWSDEQVSIVHFYFGKAETYPKLRKELFGFTELFASTGGILGLCLGFSALSLLEILYFCTVRLYFNSRNKKNGVAAQKPSLKRTNSNWQDSFESDEPGTILYPNFFYREMMPKHRRQMMPVLDAYKNS